MKNSYGDMNIVRLCKIIYKIIIIPKTINLPQKNELIILDQVGSNKIADNVLGHLGFTVLHARGEILSFPLFLYALFFVFKYGRYAYEICFIKYVGAKLALTFIDTNYHYCEIFKHLPDCKLGMIQNGRVLERFNNLKYNFLECDYYFINGDYVKLYLEKYIKAKYIVTGSIIANQFKKKKHHRIKRVIWISHFRDIDPDGHTYNFHKKVSAKDFYYKPIEIVLRNTKEFCSENNLSFEIASRTDLVKEFSFYKRIIDDFIYHKNDIFINYKSTYNLLKSDSIVAGLDSQFLYEAFGLGFRTAFFSTRGYYIQDESFRFGWPNLSKDYGPFWVNIPNENYIKNVLDNLFKIDEEEWCRLVEKFRGVMHYDYGNSIMRDIIRKEGIKLNLINS